MTNEARQIKRNTNEEGRARMYRAFHRPTAVWLARRMSIWLMIDAEGVYWVVGEKRLREANADGLTGVPWKG